VDIINWWLGWPGWLQDVSIVFALLVFLSHGNRVPAWPRKAS
jgi:hypothetical protein